MEILIKKVREEKKLTLDELSKLTGINKGNLSRIERGEVDAKISTVCMIAKALKVSLDDIIKYKN